jgi:hypothetical protein
MIHVVLDPHHNSRDGRFAVRVLSETGLEVEWAGWYDTLAEAFAAA